MSYILTFFIIFIVIYLSFNIYGLRRIWLMRLPGDKTQAVIIIYLIVILSIIIASFFVLSILNWNTGIGSFLKK